MKSPEYSYFLCICTKFYDFELGLLTLVWKGTFCVCSLNVSSSWKMLKECIEMVTEERGSLHHHYLQLHFLLICPLYLMCTICSPHPSIIIHCRSTILSQQTLHLYAHWTCSEAFFTLKVCLRPWKWKDIYRQLLQSSTETSWTFILLCPWRDTKSFNCCSLSAHFYYTCLMIYKEQIVSPHLFAALQSLQRDPCLFMDADPIIPLKQLYFKTASAWSAIDLPL